MTTVNVPSKKGGFISIDADMLEEVLTRFDAVCALSARLCNELEDSPDKSAKEFDTEELLHHSVSDYSTEIRQELRDLVADMGEAVTPNHFNMEDCLFENARELLSEDGENPEYDRAVVELVSRMFGLSADDFAGPVFEILQQIENSVIATNGKPTDEIEMSSKRFSQREMESAVEIANIAGGYGYHTANSRDAMSQFMDWAVEFEKVPYIDDDWMELIETFAEEKMLEEVCRGGAQFLGDYLSKEMSARLEDDQCQSDAFRKSLADAEKIASGKGSCSHVDQKVDQSVSGVVMGVTDQHVVLSQGRSAVICKCGALDFVPIMGDEATISFNDGWGTVSVVRDRGQQGNER